MWHSVTDFWDSNPLHLDNWISNGNTDDKNNKKHAQIDYHSKRQHTITHMNDNLNMDIIVAWLVNSRTLPTTK